MCYLNFMEKLMKKALIISGSPRLNGDTASMIEYFKKNFKGETEILQTYPQLNPNAPKACTDCRGCIKHKGCILKDDFSKFIADDYDFLVIASPLYMSNLTPPLWNIISRFNYIFNNKKHLNIKTEFKEKVGALFLAGGGGTCKILMGQSNEENAIKEAKYIFSKLNANFEENIVCSLNTNNLPFADDENAKSKIIEIANKFNALL